MCFIPDAVVQGTWGNQVNGSMTQSAFYNPSAANADECTFTRYLSEGTYTCKIMYQSGTSRPICFIKIDGVDVASVDTYAGSDGGDLISNTTSIVVGTSGVKSINLEVRGKNASGSGYNANIQILAFIRTA